MKKKHMRRQINHLNWKVETLRSEIDLLNGEAISATRHADELFDALQEAWSEITRLKRETETHWVDDLEWEINQDD
jgi:uncharacterized coiled-coil DUF342 family protein